MSLYRSLYSSLYIPRSLGASGGGAGRPATEQGARACCARSRWAGSRMAFFLLLLLLLIHHHHLLLLLSDDNWTVRVTVSHLLPRAQLIALDPPLVSPIPLN